MNTLIFEGVKYQIITDAEPTSRVLNWMSYNDKEKNDGEYRFEMFAEAIDEEGSECYVYWIFWHNEDMMLEDYDYSNPERIEYK